MEFGTWDLWAYKIFTQVEILDLKFFFELSPSIFVLYLRVKHQ